MLVACLRNPIFVPAFDWSMSKITSLRADTKTYHTEQCVIQIHAVRKTKHVRTTNAINHGKKTKTTVFKKCVLKRQERLFIY